MITIKKEKLIPGMILASDLIGKNGIIIKAETPLTSRFIGLVLNPNLFNIMEVPITDDSYNSSLVLFSEEMKQDAEHRGESSELYSKFGINKVNDDLFTVTENLTDCADQLNIPGNLSVNGKISDCPSLFVSGTVYVRHNVTNSGITAKKDIQIIGDVINDSGLNTINCFGHFSARKVSNTRINAGSIEIQKSITNSDLKADINIEGPYVDNVIDSQLQAGVNIILGSVRTKTTLIIFSEKQGDLIRKLMNIEKKISEFDKEMEPLKQTIKVYQLLKDRLHELPVDKRDKLMNSLKLVKTKLEKKKFLDTQFTTLKIETDKIKKSREQTPIVINDEIAKGTRVIIDNHSFVVQIEDKGVIFYKKSFIIMGKKARTGER